MSAISLPFSGTVVTWMKSNSFRLPVHTTLNGRPTLSLSSRRLNRECSSSDSWENSVCQKHYWCSIRQLEGPHLLIDCLCLDLILQGKRQNSSPSSVEYTYRNNSPLRCHISVSQEPCRHKYKTVKHISTKTGLHKVQNKYTETDDSLTQPSTRYRKNWLIKTQIINQLHQFHRFKE